MPHLQAFDGFGQEVHRVATESYSTRTDELRRVWSRMLSQSAFLTIKYGMIDAERVLTRMSGLDNNWDSYGAEPPTAEAIQASRLILAKLYEALIRPSTIVPSASGGISIYFFSGDRSAYIENYNDGAQALVMYDRQGSTKVLELGRDIQSELVATTISSYLD